MKWRVYNENNWSDRMGCYFATYFRTKKEAVAFAETLPGAVIEKQLVETWVRVN